MAELVFPEEWGALRHPHVRFDLLAELRDLSDPRETSRWLNPDPDGPIVGIEQTVHFFFDDHEFNHDEIGLSLFDDIEVDAVLAVVMEVERVIGRGKKLLSSRDALNHPAWSKVEEAALRAFEYLSRRGVPVFEESKT